MDKLTPKETSKGAEEIVLTQIKQDFITPANAIFDYVDMVEKVLDDADLQSDDEITWPMSKAIRKALCKGEPTGFSRLAAVRDLLAAASPWEPEHLEYILTTWAEANCDGNLGKVAQPIRVAVSGGPISPPIFDTLEILGKDAVLNRIDRCLASEATMMQEAGA